MEAQQASQQPQQPPREWYDPEGYQRDWYGQQGPQEPAPQPVPAPREAVIPDPGPPAQASASAPPVPNDETVALRTADTRRAERTPEGDEPVAA